jgi:pyridoxamine 5'-phosphate oxidase
MSDQSPIPSPRLVPQDLRIDYGIGSLDESQVARDPIQQFARWWDDVEKARIVEPNAMTLATADASGAPAARVVLLKAFDACGFSFFTNYHSRKGRELDANPRAALVFYWQPLERQVRVEGTVEKTTREESEAYFNTRPPAARIGAWVSRQSDVIRSRQWLEQRQAELAAQYGENVPLPPFWGGYRVVPQTVEFWQGRPSRLHDRIRYTREAHNSWRIERLSP